ncbi:hypothetical protein ABZU32_29465 [Sphaerisporangium sp. NPDC005288]|uniref:hypothetical protein n=1 Tax=unclassified Sphaerisporangium TaxID=2630420 RepID=UPI0033A49096
MLQRIRAIVVTMALGAGALALVSTPASATAQAAPTVTSVDVSPSTVVVYDKDGKAVTFSFLVDGATTGGFTLKRPDGSTVDVEAKKVGDSDGKQKWQGTRTFTRSDASGRWSVTAKATSVVGTGTASESFRVLQIWHTHLSDFRIGPDPADEGDRLVARGRLSVERASGWDGSRGKKVDLLFKADGSRRWKVVGHDWTDRGGRFWISTEAVESGWFRAAFDGAPGVRGTSSRPEHVTVHKVVKPAATRVVRFNASPEPVKYGRYLTNRGTLQVWDGDHWTAYDHTKVALYFKRAHHSKWEYVKTVGTNGAGAFSTKVKAWHSGYWKVVFKGGDDTKSSTSKADYVKVKR